MITFYIFIFSFSIIISQSNQSFFKFITDNSALYKNEICSYNGYPNVKSNSIECDCYSSFVNEPREDKIKYIGNQKVQCSYKKKNRFTTFFYAGILPIGLDYYYLGYTQYFILILIVFVIVIVNNIFQFYLTYQIDEKSDFNKNKRDDDANYENNANIWHNSNKKMNKIDRYKKILKIYSIINIVSLALFGAYWIVDIVLQFKGIIKDSNGVETYNDISILFSKVDI